jgi:hypothetical protein
MNAWSGIAAGVTLGTDGTMTVFVRDINSGVDGFFLPRVTIVYEGRVELYFGGLQGGESSDDQLRVGLGGVAGGEEERGGKAIKTESGCHCSDDVQEGIKNVEERGGDEPDGGENGEHQEAGSSNNVQLNA